MWFIVTAGTKHQFPFLGDLLRFGKKDAKRLFTLDKRLSCLKTQHEGSLQSQTYFLNLNAPTIGSGGGSNENWSKFNISAEKYITDS